MFLGCINDADGVFHTVATLDWEAHFAGTFDSQSRVFTPAPGAPITAEPSVASSESPVQSEPLFNAVGTLVLDGGSPPVTFHSTLDKISNLLQAGLIDNEGLANSLSQKIQSAEDAAMRGQTQAAKNILGAFKNDVNAQAGKHVTGIAVQVLLQDADSLLNQLH